MTRKTPPPPAVDFSAFDAALGAAVGGGWTEPPSPRLDAGLEPLRVIPQQPLEIVAQAAPAALAYPPLPEDPRTYLEPQAHGGALKRAESAPEGSEELPTRALLDVGILTDLVSGVKTADQAAGSAGVTPDELHSALASTLAQVDQRELAKAMGIQVATSQLKATAVWNAVLADLLEDIRWGRAKPDVKIELMKLLQKVGRLEPKEQGPVAGGGFQLNINIGDGPKPIVIEASN